MMDSGDKNTDRSKGSMITAVLFMVFVTLVGMTLLTHTITQNRIIRYRIEKTGEIHSIQRELIHYLHCFREKILSADLTACPHPETDYFTGEFFPDTVSGGVVIQNQFSSQISENHTFRSIRVTDRIHGRKMKGNQVINAHAVIDLLSGFIPLNRIPLLAHTERVTSPDQGPSGNDIRIDGTGTAAAGDLPVDFDVTSFLIDALKIQGGILNWARVRERFGFEVSDDPIETGIYFMVDDNTLESVFIQGDVQKLVFSVRDDRQVMEIHFQGERRELCYRPGKYYFRSWNEGVPENTAFHENIIVNGNLWSLEQKGDCAFHEDSNLKLLVSGQTIIRTPLVNRNLEVEKLNLTRLTLIAACHSLFDLDGGMPGVRVETGEKTRLQATLMVDGEFDNRCPELELYGSLYARTLHNTGDLNIHHMGSRWDSGNYFHTMNVTLVVGFFIDCIEEVHHAWVIPNRSPQDRIHRG